MNKLTRIIFTLYVIINALFVWKYIQRIYEFPIIVVAVYVLLAIVGIWCVHKWLQQSQYPLRWLIGLSCIFVGFALTLQYTIDPLNIQVDRWSAIHNFLAGMLRGEYPYGCQTHLGGYGSPFPVWQVFHLPFYLLGNVGLSIVVVLLIYIWSLKQIYSTKTALIAFVLFLASPAFWYEIAVRSDLITNVLFVATMANWFAYKNVKLDDHTTILAIVAGLILSTRFVALIPLCVLYGVQFLTLGWKKQLYFLLLLVGTFALTFVPFIFWRGSTLLFFEYNPFVLQTRQGSWVVLIIFAVIAIALVLYLRKHQQYRSAITGIVLTLLVVLAFGEKMLIHDLWTELFSSNFDITYLSIALPFYIEHLSFSITDKLKTA